MEKTSIRKKVQGTIDRSATASSRASRLPSGSILCSKTIMIDNEYYDREAASWWSATDGPLKMIRYTMNPLRSAYVKRILAGIGYDNEGKCVLDVGCGGGFLAEEAAKYGLETTGIDPSKASLVEARANAKSSGLDIDYHEGFGEDLPFEDETFDIVFCCDVFEHVKDFPKVIEEIGRVLKPGGLIFFETINKTILSYFVVIFVLQNWSFTRVIPRNIHSWNLFVRPSKLKKKLGAQGIETKDLRGVMPGWNLPKIILGLHRKANEEITFDELCKVFKCRETRYKGLCYIGYAEKRKRTI